jgi:catechol 2,3-dioxygenase-like lactoylglutathione lyase family enzyme
MTGIEEGLMFDHISIGVRDLARTKQFYDNALAPLGYRRLYDDANGLGYGRDAVSLWIGVTEHPVPPDAASNLHFCFSAPSRRSIDDFHGAAVASGGADNGAPGLRTAYGPDYYAAFVVDPDGYRLEAYCCDREG